MIRNHTRVVAIRYARIRGLGGQLQEVRRERDPLLGQDFPAPNVLPRHLHLQIDLQFAGIAVARLAQRVLAQIDDFSGQARVRFGFLHQPEV
jgi:hypothetical protein